MRPVSSSAMADGSRRRYDRRTVLKAGGVLGATAALPLAANTARAAGTVDDRLDLTESDALHEVIVVFDDDESVARLSGDLDLRETSMTSNWPGRTPETRERHHRVVRGRAVPRALCGAGVATPLPAGWAAGTTATAGTARKPNPNQRTT